MNIAMVEQSQVDTYVDRVQRFVTNVHEFAEHLNEMLSGREDASGITEEPRNEPITQQFSEAATTIEPELSSTVTADDVDIDALLSDLSLGDDIQM